MRSASRCGRRGSASRSAPSSAGPSLQEFIRGAQVRQGASGADVFTALIGLVNRQRRRYGGYIVHLGIVLMFLGFAGQGYKLEENMKLNPGKTGQIGKFTVRHDSITVTNDDQKQMITGHVTVLRDGKEIAQMEPARWFFAKHEDQPTTEVAIRRAVGEDVYVVLAAYEVAVAERDLRRHGQPARQLDLARLRPAGDRHRPRAAAGAGAGARRRQGARGRGHDDAGAAAPADAVDRARADGGAAQRAAQAARSGI